MKILILTCNTGQGHNSTADSIKEKFINEGVACEIADALSFVSPKMSDFICNTHAKLYKYAPVIFDLGYELAEKHPSVFANDSVAYNFFCLGVKKLESFVEENKFTGIISVHMFCALMVTELKKNSRLNIKTAFVSTDYTCHPGVQESNMDAYFIPHENLIGEFVACGVPEEKIIASGIPVKRTFYEKGDKSKAKETLGLNSNQPHILMMCGSMGCGPMENMTEKIKEIMPCDAHLTVVCGTNTKLKKKIEKHAAENITVLGYANNVSLLMDSADLYVTKPGGLSTTEAAMKRLPLAFIDAVSGCESYNRYFFLTRGMAIASNDQSKLPELIIKRLINEPALKKQRDIMEKEFSMDPQQVIFDYFM
ncbi:MAG: polysaccharide biosynthesis protein [Clostridiales bacterium]|nr:polysaccharide biosynthesis protein [Clostridiales bacterium]